MLYNSPHHVSDIAQSHGWESLFLWQLTPTQETPTVATPVMVRFEPRELGQPRNGEAENGSSYQRIDSNMDPSKVEKMPSVAEQEKDPNIKSESGQDKNRIEEESSTNRTINENGGTISTIAVTPDHDSPTSHVLTPSEEDPGDSDTRYRSRSSAIVNPNTRINRPISISTNAGSSVFGGGGGNKKLLVQKDRNKRDTLTYSKCWDDETIEESDEIWRTCNIVTETLAYILWRSTDNHTDRPPWKVCS